MLIYQRVTPRIATFDINLAAIRHSKLEAGGVLQVVILDATAKMWPWSKGSPKPCGKSPKCAWRPPVSSGHDQETRTVSAT